MKGEFQHWVKVSWLLWTEDWIAGRRIFRQVLVLIWDRRSRVEIAETERVAGKQVLVEKDLVAKGMVWREGGIVDGLVYDDLEGGQYEQQKSAHDGSSAYFL